MNPSGSDVAFHLCTNINRILINDFSAKQFVCSNRTRCKQDLVQTSYLARDIFFITRRVSVVFFKHGHINSLKCMKTFYYIHNIYL